MNFSFQIQFNKKLESTTFSNANYTLIALNRLNGGKTAEKANAQSNVWDTRNNFMTFIKSGLTKNVRLQNSVCLSKVLKTQFVRNYSTQDLSSVDNRYKPFHNLFDFFTLKDKEKFKNQVEKQQIELVRLAEQLGIYDEKVLNLQLRLARSKTFRI
jgi:hypothetical protein